MSKNIQANLKPETVERIAEIAGRPVTRGIDKMINECLDSLESSKEDKESFDMSVCGETKQEMQKDA